MTDKQIMVNGCDVSGCGAIGTDGWCSFWEENCAKNPDCIHKKYLRKEQECEELVSKCNQLDKKCKQQSWDIGNLGYKIKNQRHEINNRLKQLDQLKVENEELKKQLTILDDEDVVVEITAKQFEEYKKLKQIFADDENKVLQQIFQKLANMR